MKSDAEEILDGVWEILDTHTDIGGDIAANLLYEYLENKRLEFVQPQGDCV
jgi:hypothetical protein